MALSIDDLLNSLKNPNKKDKKTLDNTQDTWTRIGSKDAFTELGMEGSELDDFLKDWIEENGYNNI
jgi:hypothetical protein